MSTFTAGRALAALASAALAVSLATSAAAQQLPVTMAASSAPTVPDAAAAAAALRAEAAELFTSPNRWRKVVELRLEAARIAPLSDPARVEDFWLAGNVLAYLGEPDAARRHFEEAAAAALAFGELYRAGQGYLLAAAAAARAGALESARTLIARADLLAHSPLMPQEMCDCLETRIAMMSERVAVMANAIR